MDDRFDAHFDSLQNFGFLKSSRDPREERNYYGRIDYDILHPGWLLLDTKQLPGITCFQWFFNQLPYLKGRRLDGNPNPAAGYIPHFFAAFCQAFSCFVALHIQSANDILSLHLIFSGMILYCLCSTKMFSAKGISGRIWATLFILFILATVSYVTILEAFSRDDAGNHTCFVNSGGGSQILKGSLSAV